MMLTALMRVVIEREGLARDQPGTAPDREAISSYQGQGGAGPVIAAVKVCWGPDEATARKLASTRWPTTGVWRRAEPGAAHP